MRIDIARPHHAKVIASHMRPRDVEEVRAGWLMEPLAAIEHALDHSFYSRILFYDLEAIAIYGLAPLSILGGSAQLWLFGTAAIDKYPISFARASREALRGLFQHCSLMTNVVDAHDRPALKWLAWLGGECLEYTVERNGRTFAQFIVRGPKLCRQG
jgi:hypothetical protein